MKKYFYYHIPALVILIVLLALDPIASSVLNYRVQDIYNAANSGQDKMLIIRLITFGFLLWMLKRVVVTLGSGIKKYVIANIRRDIKKDIFRRSLRANPEGINGKSGGDWVSMFTNDVTLLETRYLESILSIISGFISLTVLSTAFITLSPKLAAIIIGFGVISMSAPIVFTKILNTTQLNYSHQLGILTQKIKEYINAFPTIKNYAVEPQIERKFDAVNAATESAKFDSDFSLSIADNTGSLLAWFMQFIAVAVGVVLLSQGRMALGTVIAAQGFASDIAKPLIGLINNFNAIRSSKSIVKKLYDTTNDSDKGNHGTLLEKNSAAIQSASNALGLRFDHVSLTLDELPIIRDFNFIFEPGKKYLLVGRNGSGKSSLFRILCQHYRQTSGRITINGLDVQTMTGDELSQYVSYMNENVAMLTDSLKNNVQLYREYPNVTFHDAIQEAQIQIDLNREITDGGTNISSGEKRRIEIARTLLSDADIMVFDEVISTLDTETAYEIEKMILGFQNKTIIQVSHNFTRALIEQYDEILVIEGGILQDHGTFRELYERNDYFKIICLLKFGSDHV